MLKVENIKAGYGDVDILKQVSLAVEDNQIVALAGSNGAGKTTLTKVICRVLEMKQGKLLFDNIDFSKKEPHEVVEIGIVVVPEGRRLFPNMTILENLLVGSTCKHAKAVRNETLQYIFSIFPRLEERKKQLAKTLSGGEQQMLAIGRSLMAKPKFLILDEPSLGLSPLMVQEVFKVINQIRQQGMTVLLIEQNIKASLTICDYAYVMENGKIVLEGTGEELLENEHLQKAYLGI